MKVEITARVLHHDRLGSLRAGDVVDIPDAQAIYFAARGWVKYDTAVVSTPLLETKAEVVEEVIEEVIIEEAVQPKRRRSKK